MTVPARNNPPTTVSHLSLDKQALVEEIWSAHFPAEKKLLPEQRRSAELHKLLKENDKESVREMLMKCVKPEMLYHFVQSSFNQFGAQQIFIQ